MFNLLLGNDLFFFKKGLAATVQFILIYCRTWHYHLNEPHCFIFLPVFKAVLQMNLAMKCNHCKCQNKILILHYYKMFPRPMSLGSDFKKCHKCMFKGKIWNVWQSIKVFLCHLSNLLLQFFHPLPQKWVLFLQKPVLQRPWWEGCLDSHIVVPTSTSICQA